MSRLLLCLVAYHAVYLGFVLAGWRWLGVGDWPWGWQLAFYVPSAFLSSKVARLVTGEEEGNSDTGRES